MTNPKILDKLTKIKAHMESAAKIGSEAEAQAFAAAMARIMMEHEISMTDIEVSSRDASEPVESYYIDYNKYGKDDQPKKARVNWRESLAGIIADAHFCRILVHRKSSRITLVGRKSDCEVAEYMIVTLTRLLEKMSNSEWGKEWRRMGGQESPARNKEVRMDLSGFETAYRTAFITRLRHRYETERKTVKHEHSDSTALIRIDKRITEVNVHIESMKLGTSKALTSAKSHNALGWRRGTEAADRLDLGGKAVKTTERKQVADVRWILTIDDGAQFLTVDGFWVKDRKLAREFTSIEEADAEIDRRNPIVFTRGIKRERVR
jgi:hypothetical protein